MHESAEIVRRAYDAFNTAGGGKLAIWDAEPGHHIEIVPEPATAVSLLLGLLTVAVLAARQRRPGR
jgi:hypothetical protein